MLISLIAVIILQCIHISNHHIVHLKYIQFLFFNHTSIKLGRKPHKTSSRCTAVFDQVLLKHYAEGLSLYTKSHFKCSSRIFF